MTTLILLGVLALVVATVVLVPRLFPTSKLALVITGDESKVKALWAKDVAELKSSWSKDVSTLAAYAKSLEARIAALEAKVK